jgi:hypothetical protein
VSNRWLCCHMLARRRRQLDSPEPMTGGDSDVRHYVDLHRQGLNLESGQTCQRTVTANRVWTWPL